MRSLKKLLQNLYKRVTTKWEYLLSMIFYIALAVGSLWLIFAYQNETESEIIEGLQNTGSERAKRKRSLYIMILNLFGKKGLYLFYMLSCYIIFRYYFLPSLRKFLGKKVEDEEEGKKSEE